MAYPWSSFLWHLAALEHRPGWLRVDPLLGEHGIHKDRPAGRREFERQIERRRLEAMDEDFLKEFRRGWALGSEAFRRELLEPMEGQLGQNHPGALRRESGEAKAQGMIEDELARAGWSQADWRVRRQRDRVKLALAARWRNETTLPVKEIAARLHLGKAKGARSHLHRWRRAHAADAAQPTLRMG